MRMKRLGLSVESEAHLNVEPVRAGWAQAARKIAQAGNDQPVMGEFGNADDAELAW